MPKKPREQVKSLDAARRAGNFEAFAEHIALTGKIEIAAPESAFDALLEAMARTTPKSSKGDAGT